MGTHLAYHLKELSGGDSWSLFKHHAFRQSREEIEELVTIGREIVRKCVGSPLAIKTLGSLLRDESEVSQWENVKESEIWNIREENFTMRALKLSYSNLELSLRRCFSFCVIFPKCFEIDKEGELLSFGVTRSVVLHVLPSVFLAERLLRLVGYLRMALQLSSQWGIVFGWLEYCR